MPTKRLHEVPPREHAGAETPKRYDYQYLQAARACLELLEASDTLCVFCEWHDDYVVEREGPSCTLYLFHQVKTKAPSLGPWKLNEVFGLPARKKGSAADATAIAARMLDLYEKFQDSCTKVILVTNAGIHSELTDFLTAAQAAATPAHLDSAARKTFDRVFSAYMAMGSVLPEQEFLEFLRRIEIHDEVGSLKELADAYFTLGARIRELSEIDLRVPQAQKIGRDLVELVKRKSTARVVLPVSEETLRLDKSVVPGEVLELLSLSSEGYRELRSRGRDAVRALSRLQRLCVTSGIPEEVIPRICGMKAAWDIWERANGHLMQGADAIDLQIRCEELLSAHAAGDLSFAALADEAGKVAAEFLPKIASVEPLSKDLALGYIFALAALKGA